MKIFLKIIFVLITLSLYSCVNNFAKQTDEFLVKKKDPLILPPDFEKIPLPNSKKNKNKNSSVQSVLNTKEKTTGSSKNKSKLETMILKELKK